MTATGPLAFALLLAAAFSVTGPSLAAQVRSDSPAAGRATAGVAAKRAMTLDDGFRLVQIGGALISPDGRWGIL